jgi:hypothetical protein
MTPGTRANRREPANAIPSFLAGIANTAGPSGTAASALGPMVPLGTRSAALAQTLGLEAGRQAVHVGDGDGERRVALAAQR